MLIVNVVFVCVPAHPVVGVGVCEGVVIWYVVGFKESGHDKYVYNNIQSVCDVKL